MVWEKLSKQHKEDTISWIEADSHCVILSKRLQRNYHSLLVKKLKYIERFEKWGQENSVSLMGVW